MPFQAVDRVRSGLQGIYEKLKKKIVDLSIDISRSIRINFSLKTHGRMRHEKKIAQIQQTRHVLESIVKISFYLRLF